MFVDTRLISDKTRIDFCPFLRGQVFSLGIRLTRLTIPRSAGSFKFYFPSWFSAPHYFEIWVSFISHIMFLVFQRTKGNSWCVFILWGIHGNSLFVITRWRMNGNNLFSVVWKFTTGWFFRWVLHRYQSWSKVCFSADIYMANREWGSPTPISHCNDREGRRETASLSIILLTTIVTDGQRVAPSHS